jgi:5-methylcytosine-specific restriction endonuclease McrA
MNNYQIGAKKQWETKRKNGSIIPWNKGKKLHYNVWNKGKSLSKEQRLKISIATKLAMQDDNIRYKIRNSKIGKPLSIETCKKMSLKRIGHIGYMLGKKHSIETRRKLSQYNCGNKSHLWRGGITKINDKLRTSIEYRLWREAVFARDSWTCQVCKKRGGVYLNAHHIKRFASFPELRFAIDNGVTLCKLCHKKTDNYGRKGIIKGSA